MADNTRAPSSRGGGKEARRARACFAAHPEREKARASACVVLRRRQPDNTLGMNVREIRGARASEKK